MPDDDEWDALGSDARRQLALSGGDHL